MAERKQTSREEDFRDFEERDIREGWPYGDAESTSNSGRNAPYGSPDSSDAGIEIVVDPAVRDVEGAPAPFADGEDDAIADDDLESRIMEVLEEGGIDLTSFELTIHDGIAELEGAVDSQEESRHLISLIRRVKGVRDVRAAGLITRGVDSHIASDVDE
jgi:hypothetical protein